MADIFLSYSSADKTVVANIADLLTKEGWSVWWDHQIPVGQHFDDVIELELNKAKCVVVIWTRRSVQSEWVKNEANFASVKKIMVPLMLEQVTLPVSFSRIEAALLMDWDGERDHPEFQNLLSSIRSVINGERRESFPGTPYRRKSIFKSKAFLIAAIGILLLACLIWFWPKENNVIVQVADWKGNAVSSGEVKIRFNEYVRQQSIDKEGQALFPKVPGNAIDKSTVIEISSPGFNSLRIDTTVEFGTPMKLVLSMNTVIFIRGKVKTAAEQPISGVEINISGTRFSTSSRTDGSYDLRLEEYSVGDEVIITTNRPGFEDKSTAITLSSPEIKNQDIFLSPSPSQ